MDKLIDLVHEYRDETVMTRVLFEQAQWQRLA